MHIVKTTYPAEDIAEIKKYPFGRYGAPGIRRQKRRKATPEQIRKQNHANAARKIQLLILGNFREGNHVILKYPQGKYPETYEEAEENLSKFILRMRKFLSKRGIEFKYLACTERGKRKAALHHHLIVENDPCGINMAALIRATWNGNVFISTMYEDGEYKQLADYFVKADTKEEKKGCSYHRSRNLTLPKVEKEIKFGGWDEPTAPDGWEVITETVKDGINPVTGKKYQRYFIRRKTPYGQYEESPDKRERKRKEQKRYRKKKKAVGIPKRQSAKKNTKQVYTDARELQSNTLFDSLRKGIRRMLPW